MAHIKDLLYKVQNYIYIFIFFYAKPHGRKGDDRLGKLVQFNYRSLLSHIERGLHSEI